MGGGSGSGVHLRDFGQECVGASLAMGVKLVLGGALEGITVDVLITDFGVA